MDGMETKNLPLKGCDHISETGHDKLLNLVVGKYRMGSYELDALIWKGEETSKSSYDVLRNFRHKNAIHMLNFYYDVENEEKKGCIVIPKVIDSSFLVWFQAEGREILFDKTRKMTLTFRNMIIDLCDVIENLHGHAIYLTSLRSDDLYIKQTPRGPRLLVLLTQVKMSEIPPNYDGARNEFVKVLIDWCCIQCGVELDFLQSCFVNFIVSEKFSVEKLREYPDNWGYKRKGDYLILLLAQVKHTTVRDYILKACIKWPKKFPSLENQSPKKTPELEDLPDILVAVASNENKAYRFDDPFDYIRILRDSYIHFNALPDTVKETLKNEEGLINQIDLWTPHLWTSLYASFDL